MKKILLLLLIPLLLLAGGCKKYLDVNRNTDAPDYVEGYLYLAGIQQAYLGLYWDIRATGPLSQMMGTNGDYATYANHYYILGSDAAGETWRVTYFLQGMNLENLINQSMAAENWTLAGIGYAIKAFSWDALTKLNGDAPMKQAYITGLLSHDYDYQSEIYPQIREWAYKAIELLEKEDVSVYGTKISNNDYIYGGDKAKWIKFAYAVIVRNLASLSNKSDFSSKYAQELITAAGKSFQTTSDDATLRIAGSSQSAPYADYNNQWGTATTTVNLGYAWFQHEYAVQVFTGTVPEYDEATGNKIPVTGNSYYPYKLADKQIVTDTLTDLPGHFDPRVAVKLATTSNPTYQNISNADSIKKYRYYGGSFTGTSGPIGQAPTYYGRNVNPTFTGASHDGIGRWIYRDNAPYILTTCAEIKFCLAETYWKLGQTAEAFEAFKQGIKADMDFTTKYIYPGTVGAATGGDKITKATFDALAAQYLAGPYVEGVTDFSLSHIMMQKWIALYPWGASEAWVDMRKYHYDIDYTGEYPKRGNGWEETMLTQKWDTNPNKVYKGLYLLPAQVQNRKGSYNINNIGAPCYRLRPRYNSEYMWNLPSLKTLKPIAGDAPNYQTSIPWFAYPGELPQ